MKNIFVTGATGFVGQYAVRELLDAGWCVYAAVRPQSKKTSLLPASPNLHVVEGTMADDASILPRLPERPDAILHLAWQGTRGRLRLDERLHQESLRDSLAFVQVADALGVPCFMSAGSQAEYGQQAGVIREDTEPQPLTPYGTCKLTFYQHLASLYDKPGRTFYEPRFFSLYGAGDFEGTMVISMLQNMVKNEPCDLTDGLQMWNFLHVQDAAKGMEHLLRLQPASGVYNFGGQETKPLREFVREMRDAIGSQSALNFGVVPHNDSGAQGIHPDTTKLEATGWRPTISFSDGVRLTAESLRK